MALTKEDLDQIQQVIVTTVGPMFEQQAEYFDTRMDSLDTRMDSLDTRMDSLDTRMDSLDTRMDSLERELRDFKSSTNTRFAKLEQKIDDLTLSVTERLDNLTEDVNLLFSLVEKLQYGSAAEKAFLELSVKRQVPILYHALERIARESGVSLPTPHSTQK